MKKKNVIVPLLCILLICVFLLAVSSKNRAKASAKALQETEASLDKSPKKMEIPTYTIKRKGQEIEHTGFTVDYNPEWRIPNWVAYEITKEESLGTLPRADHFYPDPQVRGICPETYDYSNSGYDRGHMAPAGDMKWSQDAMEECFYTSNICPQNHNLNSGDWNTLEEKIRYWARRYNSVFVVCGPVVSDNPKRIGRNNVAVPDGFFKVVLCKVGKNWQALGFYFDNTAGHKPLRTYCKSVDEIEEMTKIDFYPLLEDKIENKIESSCDIDLWNL